MVSERVAESRSNNNNNNNVSRIITNINRKKVVEEAEVEEYLMAPPKCTSPQCAMAIVPPGISKGTARTRQERARV